MKPEAALGHWWLLCALHHVETRRCISLPFSISFIANIARKRPELNRDKTNVLGLDATVDRKRIKQIIETWLKSGALVKVKVKVRGDDRKERPCLKVGEWATE
jgi:hypothetical protein